MNILFTLLALMAVLALLATCVWLAKRNPLTFLANIADGTHENGLTKLVDAAITTRNLVVKIGTDANHVALAGVSDIPLGVATDEAAAAEDPVNVAHFGATTGTLLGVASAAIAAGDLVVAAASGKLRTLPTAAGTYHIVGRAIYAATGDGDTFEFAPTFPIQRVVAT
jgi:hypothetical protein